MELGNHGQDPFSSEGLWRLSSFTLQSLQPLEPLHLDEGFPDLTSEFFANPLKSFEREESNIYQLNIFGTDYFGSYGSPGTTTDASSEHQPENADRDKEDLQDIEDIWLSDQLDDDPGHEARLRSWENYEDPSFREPFSAYFSETGAKGFDAALVHQAATTGLTNSGLIARNDVFFRALVQLGLGWNSLFFRYNYQKRRFEKDPVDVRISGVSLPTLDRAVEAIQQCGTDMLKVRNFVRNTAAKSNHLSSLSAFASAAAVIIYTLESLVSKRYADLNQGVSLLRINAIFQRCGELVGALANMIEEAEKTASDAQVISVVLNKAAYFAQRYIWAERIYNEISVRVAQPWLGFVETWIGLRSEEPTFAELLKNAGNFVVLDHVEESWKTNPRPSRIEYRYCSKQMPSLIPADQAHHIFETGRSLRLLKRSHPQHPIASNNIIRATLPPKLHCAIAWSDIERIQSTAYEYEAKLRAEILKYNNRGETSENEPLFEPPSEAKADKILENTYEMFDIDDEQRASSLPTKRSSVEDDSIGRFLDGNPELFENHEGTFGPELASALYLSLAPIISSQARLIDFSCLHLLFKEHDIRHHLDLQWRFQLLGDGFFALRLSNALFDPEMESGERRSGVVRSGVHTGLRLGSRDTWPPASSELRLVLTSLLNECYSTDINDHEAMESLGYHDKEVPGGLSFAIRDLSDDELVKCKDPNAIEALDFLRLQYKPSTVIETVLTPHSLQQYDILFRHLLRLIRMVSVVNGLVRDSTSRGSLSGDTRNLFQRFRIEAQHFVLSLSDYCFNVGIGSNWKRFQDTLSRIEHCLDRGDIDGTIEAAHSIPRLRQYHEDILDQMLFALFLSKRHVQVAKLLESIFGTILSFAAFSRLDGMSGIRHENEEAVLRLHAAFRKRVSSLVRYLRQLDGSRASRRKSFGGSAGAAFASSSRAEPTSVFEHLLVRLDMKQYYY
ncbi:hypothetical protein MPDQ_003842 [Monascus purpureus]|uniref:Spindle pole body component n=1 Tax=Monascus purpureus TaxID=5098 RepID=A0A507R2Y3_MONPU|nr:hypothetical protein MPDQ_003842 [Monascus purpureus]BDD59814.1 hypothetical protein MAP00_005001 [Monascus purpureus]